MFCCFHTLCPIPWISWASQKKLSWSSFVKVSFVFVTRLQHKASGSWLVKCWWRYHKVKSRVHKPAACMVRAFPAEQWLSKLVWLRETHWGRQRERERHRQRERSSLLNVSIKSIPLGNLPDEALLSLVNKTHSAIWVHNGWHFRP